MGFLAAPGCRCVFLNTALNSMNKAVYAAESVACDWAGAVMQKLPERRRKNKCVTDQPTDRQTDTAGYRVACTRLKMIEVIKRELYKTEWIWLMSSLE